GDAAGAGYSVVGRHSCVGSPVTRDQLPVDPHLPRDRMSKDANEPLVTGNRQPPTPAKPRSHDPLDPGVRHPPTLSPAGRTVGDVPELARAALRALAGAAGGAPRVRSTGAGAGRVRRVVLDRADPFPAHGAATPLPPSRAGNLLVPGDEPANLRPRRWETRHLLLQPRRGKPPRRRRRPSDLPTPLLPRRHAY